MEKILVVDDEPSIVTLLKFNLEKAGFSVITANDGNLGFNMTLQEKPHLIILDLMLPGMDGMDVCKKIRQEKIDIPILMLTARDDEFDKVLGLELGADDYLTKPFSPREMVARVKAVLRRTTIRNTESMTDREVIQLGKLRIYPEQYEVSMSEETLELTPKEFELLYYLVLNKGRVLSRDQLLNAVWDYEFIGESRIVDVHIGRLREKIESNTKQPLYIKTVRGFGYKLDDPKP